MAVLREALIDWDGPAPRSRDFGDIYFAPGDGLSEATHVFLAGNDLPRAWRGKPHFCVGETGFGTGLNIAALWRLWRKNRPAGGHLSIVSTEAQPVAPDDMRRALAPYREIAHEAEALAAALPPPVTGFHRLVLPDPDVTLTLLYGEAAETLSELDATVDAWFLDGFAPARNPQLWSDRVFGEIARLSATGATAATFTVAGAVRRALETHGFSLERAPGYGRKKEMLKARLLPTTGRPETRHPPWFTPPAPQAPKSAIVLGGGIAGAALGASLTRRGADVTVIDRETAARHPAPVVMPRLSVEETAGYRLHEAAFFHARALYRALGAYDETGMAMIARTQEEARRFSRIASRPALPVGELTLLDAETVKAHTGIQSRRTALFLPGAGAAAAETAISRLLQPCRPVRADVARLTRDGDGWQVFDEAEKALCRAEIVIVAAGAGSRAIGELSHLPLRLMAGQVTGVGLEEARPKAGLAFGGTLVPTQAGIFAGATYEKTRSSAPPAPIASADAENLKTLREATGLGGTAISAWTGVRATAPDRLPIAGPAPDAARFFQDYAALSKGPHWGDLPEAGWHDGLFTVCGLGSRGFVTAPLMAELVTATLFGEPVPLPRDLVHAVSPARFLIRALKRGDAAPAAAATKKGAAR